MICTNCGESSDRLSGALTEEQRRLVSAGLCIACALSRSSRAGFLYHADQVEFDYGKPFPEELR